MLDAQIDSVISTGAGVALSFLPLANAKGIATHYIESSARVHAPSLTGRLLAMTRGISLYTQYPQLADSRWLYAGSVFDAFTAIDAEGPPPLRRVFITIGTLEFSFLGLLERLRAILPADVEVVVQAGSDGERIAWTGATVRSFMDPAAIRSEIAAAAVVVAHASIGSALAVLESGKVPVLIPRIARRHEHVDNHQMQIARYLSERRLAVSADAQTVTVEHLAEALARGVARREPEPPFVLQ